MCDVNLNIHLIIIILHKEKVKVCRCGVVGRIPAFQVAARVRSHSIDYIQGMGGSPGDVSEEPVT